MVKWRDEYQKQTLWVWCISALALLAAIVFDWFRWA
jgi:hypothetical protein